jgi:HEAT repeat protein
VTLGEIESGLGSRDPEERRRATARLASEHGHIAVQLLLRALGDEDWRVRKEATEVAIARAPAPDMLRALVETLAPAEENVGLRNAAVEALGGYGAAAVDVLSVVVSGLDADGRKLVAQALGRTGELAALVVLRTLIPDSDPNVGAAAIEAVTAIGATRVDDVASVLERCLDTSDSFQQLAALNGLNTLGVVLSWERIQGMLVRPMLLAPALVAAGRAAHPEAAAVLVESLDHPRQSVRGSALRALVDFIRAGEGAWRAARRALNRLPETVQRRLLESACKPTEALDERRAALLVVGALGGELAAEVAVGALFDDQVAEEAEEALVMLGQVAMVPLVDRIRTTSGVECALAIELAGRLADDTTSASVAEAILPALRGESPDVIEAALTAVARIGDQRALRPASRWLSSDVPRVRRGAAAAVAAIARRHPEAARALARSATVEGGDALAAAVITGALPPPVRECLDDDVAFLSDALSADNTLLRRAALDALAGLGSALAVDAVAFALTDEEPGVRSAAVRALGAMRGDDGSAPGIAHLLELVRRGTDEELLVAAINALGRTGDPRALEALHPLVRSGDPMLAVHAIEALGRVEHPRRAAALAEALSHSDAEVVKAALQVLVDDSEPSARRYLDECLDHPAWDVRRLVADLLGRVGGRDAMAQLRARLAAEKEPLVREAIQRALLEFEEAEVVVRRTTPPPMRQR